MHDATKHCYGPKRKVSNKQFSLTRFFPGHIPKFPRLLANFLTFPWQLSNSQTFPGFPETWSSCEHAYEVSQDANAWSWNGLRPA